MTPDEAVTMYPIPTPRFTYPASIRRFIVASVLLVMVGVGAIELELRREHHVADDLLAERIQARLQDQELEEHRQEEDRLDRLGRVIQSAHNPTNCAAVKWASGTMTMLICDPDANGDPYWYLRGRVPSLNMRRHRWGL
jgi:hypothetical protein